MSKYKLSVVIPCYNEEGNIHALYDRLQKLFNKHKLKAEIVFVNDSSNDETPGLINDLAKKHSNVKAFHHETNQGMEKAWNTGIENAKGNYVCLIDADLQYLPEEIWKLYRKIQNDNYDLVQGVRSSIGRVKDSRYLLSKALNFILNIIFGMNAKDNKSGFVIAERETLKNILKHKYNYHYFQTFITVSAKVKGYSIGEVETLFQSRYAGESFINKFPLQLVLKVLSDLAKGFAEYVILKDRIGSTDEFLAEYSDKIKEEHNSQELSLLRQILFKLYFWTFPIHKWKITKKSQRYYHHLKKTQWLKSEDIEDLQNKRLRRLIKHVYTHVPYYRNLFNKNNIKVEDIKTSQDLEKIPLLSKQEVSKNLYFDLFADNHKKSDMLEITTSGSTGNPFVTYADKTQLEMRFASTLRSMEWSGWKFGDKQIRLWHQKIGMTKEQYYKEKIDSSFMRREFVPAFELDEGRIQDLLNQIKHQKPYLLDGYAECFNFIARYAKQHPIEGIKVPAIISSAQTLTDETRDLVESSLNTKIYDKYGSREFSGIAYQCEHGSYHTMSESYIVEIVKDGKRVKAGESGEVVITDLNNFSLPLIRYQIGDIATASDGKPCKCGRGLQTISKIEGRKQSVIICLDGKIVPSTFFSHLMKDYFYAFKQYQVIQDQEGEIIIKLVKAALYTKKAEQDIIAEIKKYLGNEMSIKIDYLDNIPLGKTGKHIPVLCNLDLSGVF